jgi:hypothetical protein
LAAQAWEEDAVNPRIPLWHLPHGVAGMLSSYLLACFEALGVLFASRPVGAKRREAKAIRCTTLKKCETA